MIHPLWDNITYSDEGEFAGQPIYDRSENRISRTLHRDLEKCGFHDDDIQEFLRVPNGSRTQQFDASGKLVASIYKDELTTGVYVIRISCAK